MVDLDAVYRAHSASVYRFLLAKTGSRQLAEELTQETFYQAVRSIDRFDGSCEITTFLFGIAKNVWYNACRKGQKTAVPLEETEPMAVPSAETDVLARMGREEILSAIHRMGDGRSSTCACWAPCPSPRSAPYWAGRRTGPGSPTIAPNSSS